MQLTMLHPLPKQIQAKQLAASWHTAMSTSHHKDRGDPSFRLRCLKVWRCLTLDTTVKNNNDSSPHPKHMGCMIGAWYPQSVGKLLMQDMPPSLRPF